jgi:erythromycin esterase-like protein
LTHAEARRARRTAVEVLRERAWELERAPSDLDPLLDRIGGARFVLLGEATHGTHEFYRVRAEITRRLIEERGFAAVAVEADWPDAYRVNRWVRAASDDGSAEEALAGFRRFPTWMWRNADVLDLVGWLREYNDALPAGAPRAGCYGLDLYALFTSIEAVITYLDTVDPELARRARQRYACFEHFGADSSAYGVMAARGLIDSCEDQAVAQLLELRRHAAELAGRDGRIPEDEFFHAEQNARLVRDAEEYYRAMYRGRVHSWNLRDRHMMHTLGALSDHLRSKDGAGRVVVWAHNSHLGDARATEMGAHGEWNVGQLARERFGGDAVLVGFTTYTGTVTAASDWDEPAERKRVRPALAGSYEALFHETGIPRFLLTLRDADVRRALAGPLLERAIGVIYLPRSERSSHYFHARLPEQFDVVFHYDHTRAVEPLEKTAGWVSGEPPETFPEGI